MSDRERILTVTKDDCEWQYFRAGGKGGQAQNKTNSGVRCIHHPSGAVGESREECQQLFNRRLAFKRMTESREFQSWLKRATAKHRVLEAEVDAAVEKQMREANLLIEVSDGRGDWIPIPQP